MVKYLVESFMRSHRGRYLVCPGASDKPASTRLNPDPTPVFLRTTLELSALGVLCVDSLCEDASRFPTRLPRYYAAERHRDHLWQSLLNNADSLGAPRQLLREALYNEILLSEVATRVWTATLSVIDERTGGPGLDPLVRRIYIRTLEARRDVLDDMLHGQHLATSQILRLDRLRRRCERWSDTLLSQLQPTANILEFAIEPARVREAAAERFVAPTTTLWPMLTGGLAAAFGEATCTDNTIDAQRDVLAAMIHCLPPSLFNGHGSLISHSLRRFSWDAVAQRQPQHWN